MEKSIKVSGKQITEDVFKRVDTVHDSLFWKSPQQTSQSSTQASELFAGRGYAFDSSVCHKHLKSNSLNCADVKTSGIGFVFTKVEHELQTTALRPRSSSGVYKSQYKHGPVEHFQSNESEVEQNSYEEQKLQKDLPIDKKLLNDAYCEEELQIGIHESDQDKHSKYEFIKQSKNLDESAENYWFNREKKLRVFCPQFYPGFTHEFGLILRKKYYNKNYLQHKKRSAQCPAFYEGCLTEDWSAVGYERQRCWYS